MIIRWEPAKEEADKFVGTFDGCPLEIRKVGNKWKLFLHNPREYKPDTEKKWKRINGVEEETPRAAFRKVEAMTEKIITNRVRGQILEAVG